MRIKNLSRVAFLTAILFLSACTKEKNVGEDIVELPGDKLNVVYVDTLSIEAYSLLDDSVRSDEASLSTLGSYKDDVFGTSTCGFYTQLRLASNNVNFGVNAVCDSVVLSMRYYSVFGDTLFYHIVKVYELLDTINKDSKYYINMPEKPISATPLATEVTQFKKNDSVTVGGVKVAPQLRIKLDKNFGDKIILKSGQTELSSNEEFIKYIKGLYVTTSKTNAGGGFATFDLISTISQVTLYYHNSTDTSKINLLINTSCARINVCDHYGYVDASQEFKNQVLNHDSTLGNQKLFLQSMGGVGVNFKVPHLMSLQTKLPSGQKIAVQKAELIVNAVNGTTSGIAPHSYLALVKMKSDGGNQFINESILSSEASLFDGSYNTTNQGYNFVITKQIQRFFNGDETNHGFKLLADYGLGQSTLSGSYNPNRVVMNGPKTAVSPMKLKIMYTIVN